MKHLLWLRSSQEIQYASSETSSHFNTVIKNILNIQEEILKYGPSLKQKINILVGTFLSLVLSTTSEMFTNVEKFQKIIKKIK